MAGRKKDIETALARDDTGKSGSVRKKGTAGATPGKRRSRKTPEPKAEDYGIFEKLMRPDHPGWIPPASRAKSAKETVPHDRET